MVSIIIPCYNQAEYLTDAILSVLNQSYQDWECLIINDGSPDNTEDVALNLLRLDKRIKYFKKPNGGISDARNFGIEKSKGTYILPLDGDDKIGEKYIEKAIKEFELDSTVRVVYCNAEYFGSTSGKVILPDFDLNLLARGNLIFCSALHRKSDWERIGGYDINMNVGLEDWEYWISMLKDGGKVIKIPYNGFFYRIKDSSRNNSISAEATKYLQDYICKKHADFIYNTIGNPIYLSQELKRYKLSLEYITNKVPYRLYSKFKAILNLNQSTT